MDESLIEKQNGNFANTVLGAVPSVVYNEDCVEGLKRFSDNHFDLAIVDPPYGIGVVELLAIKQGWILLAAKLTRTILISRKQGLKIL